MGGSNTSRADATTTQHRHYHQERAQAAPPAAARAGADSGSGSTTVGVPYPYGVCVFDIDGTLVPYKNAAHRSPSDRLLTALAELRARGAAVIVATGRPARATAGVPAMLGGHVDFLMATNGAGGAYQTAQPGQPAATLPSDWTEVAPSSKLGC